MAVNHVNRGYLTGASKVKRRCGCGRRLIASDKQCIFCSRPDWRALTQPLRKLQFHKGSKQ